MQLQFDWKQKFGDCGETSADLVLGKIINKLEMKPT